MIAVWERQECRGAGLCWGTVQRAISVRLWRVIVRVLKCLSAVVVLAAGAGCGGAVAGG